MFSYFKKRGKNANTFTVAFYNLENLFDIKNNPNILDDDFTPDGAKKWNYKRYKLKLKKLSEVISKIGTDISFHSPALVGVAEVENSRVLYDLIQTKHLKNHHYGFVHYNSPDERGIDVALLYKKELFELLESKTHPLFLEDENGKRDYTRDILQVKGKLNGEILYVLVNHWPSRRNGSNESELKRIIAAKLVLQITEEINRETPNAKIIIMGDFNDNPTDVSIKDYLVNDHLYNPMLHLIKNGNGSLNHDKSWHLFDQIIFTKNFFETKPQEHAFKYAEVFDSQFLKTFKGKLKGNPFRTYIGKWYQGGFSDHFPVYIFLNKN